MEQVIAITKDIKAGKVKPIYFFYGEEHYYIDKLTEFIEDNVLTEDEKGFNQMVFYGRDSNVQDIVSAAKRYPMMCEKQVIIIKEAQDLARNIDDFVSYIENPQPSTILVFAYKNKTLDKRKKFGKLIAKNGLVFESKKMYENQVANWITTLLKGRGYGIEPKAAVLLVEFLGSDLSKISNELDKLKIIFQKGHVISAKDIEENIGISKDYNVFELRKAIGTKSVLNAYQIIKYFNENPKGNNLVAILSQVNSYFIQIMQYHATSNKSKENLASVLGVHPFFVSDYITAAQNYPMKKVSGILATLRELDLKGKGVNSNNTSDYDLMKEMLITIFR